MLSSGENTVNTKALFWGGPPVRLDAMEERPSSQAHAKSFRYPIVHASSYINLVGINFQYIFSSLTPASTTLYVQPHPT